MVATRSEATRSGRVRRVGLPFRSRSEAISPKALPQGPPVRDSGDARARGRSVSDAFPESGPKWLLPLSRGARAGPEGPAANPRDPPGPMRAGVPTWRGLSFSGPGAVGAH